MKKELLKIGYDGANSTLLELLTDNSTLIYARFIGYKSTNKAIWSALHNHTLSISDGSTAYKGNDTKYFSYSKQLPSGLSEMIIISSLAIPKYIPETDRTFYVISRTEKPDYNLFFELLNKVSKVPLRKEWSEYLFNAIYTDTLEDSRSYTGIEKLEDSVNAHGWKVAYSEEHLLEKIKDGLKNKKLEAKYGTA